MKVLTDSVWSGGTLNVDGELSLHNTATLGGGIAVTGNGAIYVEGTSIVAANTTINVQTFDWDGFNFTHDDVHTINGGATFTLNIANFDADTLDDDMDDPIFLDGHSAHLNINGPAQWTMNNTLTVDNGIQAYIGGTSRMVLRSTLDANVGLNVTRRITFGPGSVADVAAGRVLWVTTPPLATTAALSPAAAAFTSREPPTS